MRCHIKFQKVNYKVQKTSCKVQIVEDLWKRTATGLNIGKNYVDYWGCKWYKADGEIQYFAEIFLIDLFFDEHPKLFLQCSEPLHNAELLLLGLIVKEVYFLFFLISRAIFK